MGGIKGIKTKLITGLLLTHQPNLFRPQTKLGQLVHNLGGGRKAVREGENQSKSLQTSFSLICRPKLRTMMVLFG